LGKLTAAMSVVRLFALAGACAVLTAGCSDSGSSSAPERRAGARVTTAGLRARLAALQTIANAHGATRAAGTAGYDASVAYVLRTLRAAGYSPQRDRFPLRVFQELAPPRLALVGGAGTAYRPGRDFVTSAYSGSGAVTAPVRPVDLRLPPGAPNSSTSACERSDFRGFPRGAVALVQRGRCFFTTKVLNAQAAGARAVLISNEGQRGRREPPSASLTPTGVRIPVLGVSYAVGRSLALAARRGRTAVRVRVRARVAKRQTANVVADLPGRSDRVVALGAHLDSVPAGPGINDDGSGVALLLEVARALRGSHLDATVRFAFWSAEELGLLGSRHYVRSLPEKQRKRIDAYLNFDMVGSPNYSRLVYGGSRHIEGALRAAFHEQRLAVARTSIGARSDHASFERAGIDVGGVFTGADEAKTSADTRLFGGRAGRPHDPCYHRACDRLPHVNLRVLRQIATATVVTVRELAG
jgi:Zn-dependent M28 family amino/carboxypeptidase